MLALNSLTWTVRQALRPGMLGWAQVWSCVHLVEDGSSEPQELGAEKEVVSQIEMRTWHQRRVKDCRGQHQQMSTTIYSMFVLLGAGRGGRMGRRHRQGWEGAGRQNKLCCRRAVGGEVCSGQARQTDGGT